MHTSPGGPQSVQCFYRQSDDETLGPWIDVRGKQNVCFYLTSNGTTSAGVVTFEEAAPENMTVDPPVVFGGATDAYAVIPNTAYSVSGISGGKQVGIHLPQAAYFYVRARISTAVTGGGTISAGCEAY